MSKVLGNTPAVCRKAYIHPEVLALAGRLASGPTELPQLAAAPIQGLSAAEQRLVGYLDCNRPTA